MQIGEKIRSLRELHKMTQKELADHLSISPSTIGMYEQNRRMPDIDTIRKIANILNVSVDELVGTKKINSNGRCENFFYEEGLANWNIRKKSEELGLSYMEVLERTGIDEERFDLLWFGNMQPFAEELLRFSEVLNVSIDYLLDNSRREKITPEEEVVLLLYSQHPKDIMDLLDSFCSLNSKDRTIVLGKCFELEQNSTSVAADEQLKEAK